MNPYTVELTDDAEQSLADIWVHAADRAAVTAAEATIHRLLTADPIQNGTHMAEGLRKLTAKPLTVFYTLPPGRRVAEISQVAYTP